MHLVPVFAAPPPFWNKVYVVLNSSYHSLAERPIHLSVGDKPLERVHSIKLLGVHMTDTLRWDDHIKHVASSCYGVLVALRKIKNFTNYHLRKHLVECLVLSRLDFNDIIFYSITDCLLKRLQRIQFAAASFVFRRYVNNIDSILNKLGWLPMKERREWHVLKAAHKAIYSRDWPRNLQLEQRRHARNLRSSSTINLVIPHASDTFQYSAAALFNSLPSNIKGCDNFKSFRSKHYVFYGSAARIGRNDFLPSLDNVCIYCITTFYCLLPSFLQIHN